ncbi:pyridoxamine 5'-phosphate oxidase-domain-containing protein [Sporodiniella umbellata]|nr:pyridoxamine 5'-phosphate oxidase-domain-containing protein [Sporodiniella umbellata]
MYFPLTLVFLFLGLAQTASTNSNFQPVEKAATLARQVVRDAGIGTIVTIMNDQSDMKGYPFGIMEYYSDRCFDNGNLLFYMSDLQLSAKNMHQHQDRLSFSIRATKDYNPSFGNVSTPVEQPRFTLFGKTTRLEKTEKALACFAKVHPEANSWQKFHDFNFYEFHVQSIYYVGGYGGLNYIGWLPLELYQRKKDALHQQQF